MLYALVAGGFGAARWERMSFRLSNHAREESKRRGIPPALLDSVLTNPIRSCLGTAGHKYTNPG